jgi:hypothetical protein
MEKNLHNIKSSLKIANPHNSRRNHETTPDPNHSIFARPFSKDNPVFHRFVWSCSDTDTHAHTDAHTDTDANTGTVE